MAAPRASRAAASRPRVVLDYSRFSFLLSLVLLEQSSARRKKRRESEEQTAEHGSVAARQHSRNSRNCTSEEKTHG